MKVFVIVGIGKSGLAAQKLLLARGLDARSIFTFDEKNTTAQYSSWLQLDNLPIGTLVVSPGVPLSSPDLVALKKKGWEITSEINLACEHLTDEVVVGITGSVGKSTVTSLLGEAVKVDDPQAFVGGNLGTPFCEYTTGLLQGKPKARFVILELSSYQLENSSNLKLDYSAITFLSANHLERYPTADDYYMTKCQIGAMTKNISVLNASSPDILKYQNKVSGKSILVNHKNITQKPALIGEHNLDNVAVAAELAKQLKLSPTAHQALLSFNGLAHRLEPVGNFHGVLFINDSKATAMDSVLVASQAALTQVHQNKTLHLLLGGKDKNLPWEELEVLSQKKNIKFHFFGQCGALAQKKSQLPGLVSAHLIEALKSVFSMVQSGDVVLLSPGGTSLDEFKNFEDRGHFFKNQILDYYSAK